MRRVESSCPGSPFSERRLRRPPALALLLVGLLFFSGTLAAQSHIQFPRGEFPKTDTSKMSVDIEEILSGGPPKDGIPAVDKPRFVDSASADEWLGDSEPVVVLRIGEQARAYPLQILMFHEIVNDVVNDVPVAVTFCPLCNASIVFDRNLEGELLDFGTTGRLRRSDLVMYDRQTETWWQQFTGRGIIGTYTDVVLPQRPSQIVSYQTFKLTYPDGDVLSRETGFQRPYGQNPYTGYDDINNNPFLYRGDLDPRLPPMERVLSVPGEDSTQLVPLSELEQLAIMPVVMEGRTVVVFAPGNASSALDQSSIARSRLIPAAAAFEPTVDGESLTFVFEDKQILDEQTRSTWNAFGEATAGALEGSRLRQVDQGVHFAFAWLAFDPAAEIHRQEQP